jgi:hypothetical protein
MQADFDVLRQRINDAVHESALSKLVNDIVIEADQDEQGDDFLRITLGLQSSHRVRATDLTKLVREIRTVVGDVDDRFPTVRFADAA